MERSNSLAVRIVSGILLLALAVFCAVDAFASSKNIVTVVDLNAAPVAENLTLTTYRGIAVTGRFRSIDPEGDAVTYAVSVPPKKGDVDIDGDCFTYTPREGKKGRDSFTYVAVDAVGNVSSEAAVSVEIKKQATKVTYADMEGHASRYAATALAEAGVFTGEKIGERWFFVPADSVTRGEFLVMCMELVGAEPFEGLTRTGFYDDGDIPLWEKPYVAAALMADVISGYKDETGRAVFLPAGPVTYAEASVILNNLLDLTDVAVMAAEDDTCPVWASQAAANLTSCGVGSTLTDYAAPLTRADAAELLLGASALLEK